MEEKRPSFAANGLGLAVITYDSPAVLRHFAERRKIGYPLLSDEGSKVIRAFGILNPNIPADQPFHGVPFPGTYVLDSKGRVKSKYFEEDYRDRVTAGSILLREFDTSGGKARESRTDHLRVITSAANDTVYTGSRVTLTLDIDLPKGMHVYAPGVQGYKPIAWDMDQSKSWLALDAAYPRARVMRLKAIGESVPVYEKKARITRDIMIGEARELGPALTEGKITVRGQFVYQACDAKVCYTPKSVPLEWTFAIQPPDRERVPANLRDKVQ